MRDTSTLSHKRVTSFGALAAGLLLAVGAGAAQHGDDRGQSGPSGAQAEQGQPAAAGGGDLRDFQSLDTNGNEIIDEQEAQADQALQRDFERIDANRDGQISPSEFASFGEVERAGDATPQEVKGLREEAKSEPGKGASPGESWFTAPEDKPAASTEGR